jgi:hypothetical protein
MKVLVAAAAGVLAAWVYRSERAREEARRRLATASGPLRQATQAVASAAAGRAERAAGAVDASPLPRPVKETARRATTAVRAAGEKLGGAMPAGPARAAVLYAQELRDGSWIGNVAWGGRTLTDGAADAQLVIRRLAARLAAMPGAGRPTSVKLTRVSRGGQR